MDSLQLFKHEEFGELGVLEINGKTYFPASACAKTLGYSNPRDAIARHCREVVKHDGVSSTTNQYGVETRQYVKMNYISEGDLYRLITHSRLPAAVRFESWVFDEVLPTIRKNGAFVPNMEAIVAQAVQLVIPQVIAALVPCLAPLKPKQRIRRRVTSAVERLETPLRMEVEEMIIDTRMSYMQISDHLRDAYGILIGKSSIGRYAQKLIDSLEELERGAPAVGAVHMAAVQDHMGAPAAKQDGAHPDRGRVCAATPLLPGGLGADLHNVLA